MNHAPKLQLKIDSYLMQLRRSLGELPPEEVSEILQEIRGHILERAESSGELTDERLVAILQALGKPEDIAPLYQADSVMAKARTSLSPTVVLRGVLRWAMMSVRGFALFIVGLIGYGVALAWIAGAVGKVVAPSQFGAWVSPGSFSIGTNDHAGARDVLGFWLIPVGLVLGTLFTIGTTRLLRWAMRFARVRRPTSPVRA
jgi:uncharacterized membrane protein